jgi:hypothetical protein
MYQLGHVPDQGLYREPDAGLQPGIQAGVLWLESALAAAFAHAVDAG